MSTVKNKSHFKALLQHPVKVEHIPHIVTAVTIMYMFAFLFLSIGFLLAGVKTVPAQQQNTLVPAQQKTVDFFPVQTDSQHKQQQSGENFYDDQPYNQEDALGQEVDQVYLTQDETQNYPEQYNDTNQEQYLDQDYYNYWEKDLGDNTYYGDAQRADSDATDVYITEPVKTTFAARINSLASGELLLFVGFSVLAMGILVFFVNHIHDNNYFSHKPHHKISKNK